MPRDQLSPPDDLTNSVGKAPFFKKIGKEFFNYFLTLGHLKPYENFLDVGCGVGRMAIPLTSYLSKGRYEGFDTNKEAIIWCKKNIESKYPNFHFSILDVYNKIYNPLGKIKASELKFPYNPEFFDFICLASVFTHLLPADMDNYFSQIVKVLKKNGRSLITYFLLNSESLNNLRKKQARVDLKFEMDGYRTLDRSFPEKGIGYDETFVQNMYKKYNLTIESIHYGRWAGRKNFLSGQDIIIARKF